MRKAIFLSACILFVCAGHAQLWITPEAGINRSVFRTDASTNELLTSAINGVQGGVLVTKNWSGTKSILDYLFVQTGLEFAQKGSYRARGYQSQYGSNTTTKLMYLQAPFNAGVNVKVYRDFGVIASAGLYIAYGISGTDKGSLQDISGTSTVNRKVTFTNNASNDINKTSIRPFDNGYNLSAGITYKSVMLKANYSLGTGNVSPTSSSIRYQNEVLNVSLGYTIRLK